MSSPLTRKRKTPRGLPNKGALAARLLRALANDRRLLVLCDLVVAGETSVNDLAANVGLSQSALSQHLALLRDKGLVATRPAGTVIYYRLTDPKAEAVLQTLHLLFCQARVQSGEVSSGG
ncbi:MAG: helix-turn-helix transcriptional regulator [Alphaproteobacteria bacterium]|nr:helix-turn-helix transcriptional regulator [Alphaproteobacteria bacterium]